LLYFAVYRSVKDLLYFAVCTSNYVLQVTIVIVTVNFIFILNVGAYFYMSRYTLTSLWPPPFAAIIQLGKLLLWKTIIFCFKNKIMLITNYWRIYFELLGNIGTFLAMFIVDLFYNVCILCQKKNILVPVATAFST